MGVQRIGARGTVEADEFSRVAKPAFLFAQRREPQSEGGAFAQPRGLDLVAFGGTRHFIGGKQCRGGAIVGDFFCAERDVPVADEVKARRVVHPLPCKDSIVGDEAKPLNPGPVLRRK